VKVAQFQDTPVELSPSQIREIVAAFGQAAGRAKAWGYDAVQLHGAHGYLINQFLSPLTNRRTDEYGGSLENRNRFAVELVRKIRATVGEDFPILFRFSQWKLDDHDARLAGTPEELARILLPLRDAGVDAFHASQRDHLIPAFDSSPLNLAGWARKLTGLPAISVGKVAMSVAFTDSFRGTEGELRPIEPLLEQMARGDYDLIAVGRALIADPDLPNKIREGRYDEVMPFQREMLKTL
jgi:2,4-dienoyl-CoA reductase-like NADH-dependent reductase (Old Yellow Enzyme family)